MIINEDHDGEHLGSRNSFQLVASLVRFNDLARKTKWMFLDMQEKSEQKVSAYNQ